MPVESAADHRRCQGAFERTLGGMQPWQDHARHQRFGGGRTPLLQVRNAAGLLSVGLLLSSLRLPREHATGTAHALRGPALLPGAGAAQGDAYLPVPARDPVEQVANTAATACLLTPRRCLPMLGLTALTALGSGAVSAWVGWRAGLQAGRAEHGIACEAGSRAEAQIQSAQTADGLPAPMRFTHADLDPAHSQCNSLYDHVNGKWHATTTLPPDQSLWTVPVMLQDRSLTLQRRLAEQAAQLELPTPAERIVADLWTTGMNQHRINAEGIRPLRDELAAIDALRSPAQIEAHLHALTAAGINPVFGFGVDRDMDARDTQIAYAFQGGLGLPDRSYYLTDDHLEAALGYRAHVAHVLRLAGDAPADAERQADAVLALERRFANASVPWEELNANLTHYYHPVSLAEADALTPGFSWSGLFQALGVDAPARFSLATPAFHQDVAAALTAEDPATWRAYLRFHTLDSASPFLGDDFVRAHHAFHARTLQGQGAMPPRWKQVLAAIERVAGEAISELYVPVAFPAETREAVTALVEQITAALKRRLQVAPWMDADTRAAALRKADRFQARIGHPERWPDWSGLHTESCGYLRNLRRATAFVQRRELARLGAPVDPSTWRMTAQTVDAYYDMLAEEPFIAFSAAILQPPYFDIDADQALNYGGIGVVIGHELSHAFSAESSQFGLDGGLQGWWSDADHQRYAALSARLAAQFDQQQVEGVPLNGQLTASENMADLGGLSIALDALQHVTANQTDPMLDGLSRVERFFFAGAVTHRRLHTAQRLRQDAETDVHAFGAPRADVGPANLPAYAEAFNCTPGSPMTRTDAERVAYL